MKSRLSRKVAKIVGSLVIIICLVFGFVFTQLCKNALLDATDIAIQGQANEDAKYIAAEIDRDLSVLNEVALRARTITMDWPTQQASLLPEIERLGYLSMAVVTPDAMAKDVGTGSVLDLTDREYIKKH